ncbi:hypothetical protein CC2G_007728 [Coprinopsis cinerea AmutBmut pab1-1]|nr:hypothetical protein CC2G_007728 [Coprinopsis cinerea AmutBmut pab1-1]
MVLYDRLVKSEDTRTGGQRVTAIPGVPASPTSTVPVADTSNTMAGGLEEGVVVVGKTRIQEQGEGVGGEERRALTAEQSTPSRSTSKHFDFSSVPSSSSAASGPGSPLRLSASPPSHSPPTESAGDDDYDDTREVERGNCDHQLGTLVCASEVRTDNESDSQTPTATPGSYTRSASLGYTPTTRDLEGESEDISTRPSTNNEESLLEGCVIPKEEECSSRVACRPTTSVPVEESLGNVVNASFSSLEVVEEEEEGLEGFARRSLTPPRGVVEGKGERGSLFGFGQTDLGVQHLHHQPRHRQVPAPPSTSPAPLASLTDKPEDNEKHREEEEVDHSHLGIGIEGTEGDRERDIFEVDGVQFDYTLSESSSSSSSGPSSSSSSSFGSTSTPTPTRTPTPPIAIGLLQAQAQTTTPPAHSLPSTTPNPSLSPPQLSASPSAFSFNTRSSPSNTLRIRHGLHRRSSSATSNSGPSSWVHRITRLVSTSGSSDNSHSTSPSPNPVESSPASATASWTVDPEGGRGSRESWSEDSHCATTGAFDNRDSNSNVSHGLGSRSRSPSSTRTSTPTSSKSRRRSATLASSVPAPANSGTTSTPPKAPSSWKKRVSIGGGFTSVLSSALDWVVPSRSVSTATPVASTAAHSTSTSESSSASTSTLPTSTSTTSTTTHNTTTTPTKSEPRQIPTRSPTPTTSAPTVTSATTTSIDELRSTITTAVTPSSIASSTSASTKEFIGRLHSAFSEGLNLPLGISTSVATPVISTSVSTTAEPSVSTSPVVAEPIISISPPASSLEGTNEATASTTTSTSTTTTTKTTTSGPPFLPLPQLPSISLSSSILTEIMSLRSSGRREKEREREREKEKEREREREIEREYRERERERERDLYATTNGYMNTVYTSTATAPISTNNTAATNSYGDAAHASGSGNMGMGMGMGGVSASYTNQGTLSGYMTSPAKATHTSSPTKTRERERDRDRDRERDRDRDRDRDREREREHERAERSERRRESIDNGGRSGKRLPSLPNMRHNTVPLPASSGGNGAITLDAYTYGPSRLIEDHLGGMGVVRPSTTQPWAGGPTAGSGSGSGERGTAERATHSRSTTLEERVERARMMEERARQQANPYSAFVSIPDDRPSTTVPTSTSAATTTRYPTSPPPIDERTKYFEERAKYLEDRSRQLEKMLKETQARFKSRESELKSELRSKENELKTREGELKAELRTKENELRSVEGVLGRRDNELRARDEEIRMRDEEIRAREEEFRVREEEVRAFEEGVRKREELLRAREEDIRRRELHIQKRNDEMRGLEEEVRSLREESLSCICASSSRAASAGGSVVSGGGTGSRSRSSSRAGSEYGSPSPGVGGGGYWSGTSLPKSVANGTTSHNFGGRARSSTFSNAASSASHRAAALPHHSALNNNPNTSTFSSLLSKGTGAGLSRSGTVRVGEGSSSSSAAVMKLESTIRVLEAQLRTREIEMKEKDGEVRRLESELRARREREREREKKEREREREKERERERQKERNEGGETGGVSRSWQGSEDLGREEQLNGSTSSSRSGSSRKRSATMVQNHPHQSHHHQKRHDQQSDHDAQEGESPHLTELRRRASISPGVQRSHRGTHGSSGGSGTSSPGRRVHSRHSSLDLQSNGSGSGRGSPSLSTSAPTSSFINGANPNGRHRHAAPSSSSSGSGPSSVASSDGSSRSSRSERKVVDDDSSISTAVNGMTLATGVLSAPTADTTPTPSNHAELPTPRVGNGIVLPVPAVASPPPIAPSKSTSAIPIRPGVPTLSVTTSTTHLKATSPTPNQMTRTTTNPIRTPSVSVNPMTSTLTEHLAQHRSSETFLTRTDTWSGAQVIQAVHDINSQILQFAASATEMCRFVSREVCASVGVSPVDAGVVPPPPASSSGSSSTSSSSGTTTTMGGANDSVAARLAAKLDPSLKGSRSYNDTLPRLGAALTNLLASYDHSNDPILVQLALQTLVCVAAKKAWESFCLGLPGKSDGVLAVIYRSLREFEPQPTSAKWRSLTHTHIHQIYPTLSAYSASELAETILRWTYDVLVLAGCGSFECGGSPSTPVTPNSSHQLSHLSPAQAPNAGSATPPISGSGASTPVVSLPLTPQTLHSRSTLLQQLTHITKALTTLENVLRQDILSTSFDLVIPEFGRSFIRGGMSDAFSSMGGFGSGVPGVTNVGHVQVGGGGKAQGGKVLGCVEIGLACRTRVGMRGPPPSPVVRTPSGNGGLLSVGSATAAGGQGQRCMRRGCCLCPRLCWRVWLICCERGGKELWRAPLWT